MQWNDEDIKKCVMRDEGSRLKLYPCTAGKLTIGYGRNLTDGGITEAEAQMMLQTDIQNAKDDLLRVFTMRELEAAGPYRVTALVSMMLNLGLARFRGFSKMVASIKNQDYKAAAAHALDSKWAKQVGNRAIRAAYRLEHNELPQITI